MVKSIQILNTTFRTIQEAEDFTRGILYKYRDNQPLQNDDLEFVLELLERHPDNKNKKGIGIKEIITGPDKKFGTTKCFYLIRLDNTYIDFSFKKCFSKNPNDPLKLFKTAARRAVENEITNFKHTTFYRFQNANGKIKCAVSGELINKESADVDHIPPYTFDRIVKDFISERNLDVGSVVFTSGDIYKVSKAFADESLRKDFASYHNQVCKLRIIERTTNLRQKKK